MDLLQYFSRDYHGAPFILFGTAHILSLVAVALFIVGLTRFKGASEQTLRRVRWTLAGALWLNEIIWHAWNIAVGTWSIQSMLPLHLCSLLIWLSAFVLVSKNYTLYEFVYFLGIGGGLQALLTPDAGIYGFPHYRYLVTIIAHGLLVSVGVYMTVVEGFRPTWASIVRVFVVANLYMLLIYFVNSAIGSNYMMVNAKPGSASLLDILPPWPWYIPWLDVLGLLNCLILYLPFMLKDWRAKQVAV
jgi:hypothetical integral membrane protein (TIGR02206 family)